jgi:DNA-binding PadR family transcriptional regulator
MMNRETFGGSFHFLARGDFAGLVLTVLREKPMHGYEIMKALEGRFQGFYKPSPGSIYPALKSLLGKGYVTVTGEERRKTYRITPKGRDYLKGARAGVKAHFEALQKALGPERAAMFREFRQTGRLVATNIRNVTPKQARELREVLHEMRERILRILAE